MIITKDKISDALLKAITTEFIMQGHKNTGKGLKSIKIKFEGDNILGFMDEYMIIQSKGVKASRIPYTRGSGKKSSEFINGLMKWVQYKGIERGKQAKGIAFAIATKLKRTGMPSPGAFRYSKNGRRLNWIEEGIKATPKILREELFDTFNQRLNRIIDKANTR